MDKIFNNLTNILPNLARISPHIYLLSIIIYVILYRSLLSLYLLVSFYIMFGSNYVFKYIFEFIYKFLNVETLPILGKGCRPKGAINCSISWNNNIPQTCLGFGMPSGHSQITWAFTTYISLITIKQINNNITNNNITNQIFYLLICPLVIIILVIHSYYISYSRVVIEHCHTTQQVFIGGFIGLCWGIIIFILQEYLYN